MLRAPLLRDAALDERFARDGFVTMPFLDAGQAADLRAAYHDAVPPGGEGMLVEYTQADRRRMAAVERILAPVWSRHLDDLFVDHRVVFSTVVVKYPGTGSSMFLHDDRTYVDERRFRAATLWIPLVDTSPAIGNGSLQVVPGSQRLAVTMSGSNTPELFRPYERHLRTGLVDVEMRAGECLLYDTRVLHASPPNLTTEPREAIVCALAPRRAELIHVVGTSARGRRVHRVDEAFFVEHSPQEIERRVPDHYPVVEEYEDTVDHIPAALVAAFGRPSAPVEADVLVPPDLLGLLSGEDDRPASEHPTRVGSLVVAPDADGLPTDPGAALVGAGRELTGPGDGAWLPAGLVPDIARGWLVGDPQVRVVPDVAGRGARAGVVPVAVARLRPGDRLGLAQGRWGPTVLRVEAAPPLGAGVVSPGRAALPRPGHSVTLVGDGPHVVWNHGPGPAEVLVGHPGPANLRSVVIDRLLALAPRRRRTQQVHREALDALAPPGA